MNRTNATRTFALAIILTIIAPTIALAWGNSGHETVCGIAYRLLTKDEQHEIDRLTKLYQRPDGRSYSYFTRGCTFPDEARRQAGNHITGWSYFSRFSRWHFLNVPRDTRTIDGAACGEDCVLEGIEYHAKRLGQKDLEDWKRAESMFFLGHWIGDIHQPLHVSFADDLGGNDIQPINGVIYKKSRNLHSVWDSGILSKMLGPGGVLGFADGLAQEISDSDRHTWNATTPLEWAQESYDITVGKDTLYCEWTTTEGVDVCVPLGSSRTLGSAYQNEFDSVVELRLQQAGARLANYLRKAFGLVKP